MTDFKFEIGEEVRYGLNYFTVTYRYINAENNCMYIVKDSLGGRHYREEVLNKIPKPKKKLYQVLFKSDSGQYFITDYLYSSLEGAQKRYLIAKAIQLIEPGIEVDDND